MFWAGSATADGDTTVLRLVWAYEAEQPGYIITESEIEGEQYPPLSDVAPAAFVEECEIYEQFGIRPEGGKPLNRLMLPPHAAPFSRRCPRWATSRRGHRRRCTPRILSAARRSSSRSGRSARWAWRACTTAW